jgi:hypothetical protein
MDIKMQKSKAVCHLASDYMLVYDKVVNLEVYGERCLTVDLYMLVVMLEALPQDRKRLNYSLQ